MVTGVQTCALPICCKRRELFISADEASSDDLCAYALHRFRADGWLASTVRAAMSAIDNRRHALGLSRLQSVDTTRRLLQAMRKARPAGNEYAGVDAFAPADLISALLPANTFYGLRQRTLFTGRAVTLARSDSFLNIRRSTIRDARDLARRQSLCSFTRPKTQRRPGARTTTITLSICRVVHVLLVMMLMPT